MKHIFISYAREDRTCAEQLAGALEAQGWPVWWDREILGGLNVPKAISEALDSAGCVIVLWSRDSVESDWVRDEAEVGLNKGILVPILIDDVEIPLGFRQTQAESLREWAGETDHPELLRAIRAVDAAYERSGDFDITEVQKQTTVREKVEENHKEDEDLAEPEIRPRDERRITPVEPAGLAARARQLITTRVGLSVLLGILFLVNWAETTFETTIGRAVLPGPKWRDQFTYAVHWFERYFSFESHDLTNMMAVYGYSVSYFLVFPILATLVGIALARRNDIAPYRVFVFSATIDYLLSLPFFLLMPVPERWAYPNSAWIIAFPVSTPR
jgi:hypothetical protein